ncbi:ectonucleoside triphosphate diphosphohydrolase 4 [Protobothrops mucrosquamatus]|uniref:ectonucleoside triphosphate diphosphohydrolase 4 n=1 Tax=Protobothrops mucrosquamatus TaxID=103944 RepID=UPI000775ABE5|nr:ectonucleoside triphosphate diphosphohydrolase 4 [Protobothrops mucrosquamatus]
MGRISFSCLFPASWHFSISPVGCPRILNTTLRQIIVTGLLAAAFFILYYSVLKYSSRDKKLHRYLARVTDTEATDTSNPKLNYGIMVDCGSSGSRIFVYWWPRHNGNPHDLLDIKQMRDENRKPVVMKIKPGISEFATSPEKVSDYIFPLLNFAAEHIPRAKHKETPLYILCTAGMRILPESQQKAILEDLLTDIPVHFDFLFSDSHAEVISGKQEGVYAWIGINFVLGKFEHMDEEDEAVVEVHVPDSESKEEVVRKRTVGILDMGGVSTQIAYEVPKTEEVAKNLLAEFNLGCDAHQSEHVYRVYVATFLGFGGNAARQRYADNIFTSTVLRNRLLSKQIGLTPETPYLDPCLPLDAEDEVQQNGQILYLRGTGDFHLCRDEYCATKWSVLRERFDHGLYASHADLHRLKYQCFKSAWMYEVFHNGFGFPVNYNNLKTALQVYDKEVQWTLGAILYRTRFLPLRDIQQENFRGNHPHWRSFAFVYNHYLFFACFFVVLLSILLYLLRLRRIHRRILHSGSSPALWIEDGLPPQKIPGGL